MFAVSDYLCIFATAKSPDGGIGRRAGLKHQWSNPCRFDPGSGYEEKRLSDFISALSRFLIILTMLHFISLNFIAHLLYLILNFSFFINDIYDVCKLLISRNKCLMAVSG